MDKILDIVEMMAHENGLQSESILSVLKESIIKMAKKEYGEDMNFVIIEDKESKDLKLTRKVLVVDDNKYDEENKDTQISLSEATKIAQDIKINDEIGYDINLEAVSKNAINNIFFDIKYQIQKLNEKQLISKFEKFIGKIVSGRVVYIDENENTYIEIDNIRATLPQKNRIKGEKFKVGMVVKSILRFAGFNSSGFYMELSRTTPKMIEELLKLEVPEIKDGEVEIIKIARIPGVKAKVLLNSKRAKIDPVGSAVGNKGVRIMSISRELSGENIDCIEYSPLQELLVQKVLSPANIKSVQIKKDEFDNQKITVQVYQSEKSKAIGKAGVNIRLANMLLGSEIELVEIDDVKTAQKEPSEKLGIQALESLFKK